MVVIIAIIFSEIFRKYFRTCSKPSKISKMELFEKMNNGFQPLTFFSKGFVSDV